VLSGGVWDNRDFRKLWAGQTISQLGSGITGQALQFVAVLVLSASPAQMGVLAALGAVPFLFFGLLAGVWVDRLRRRPLLIVADLSRGLLLATIPAAALLGRLALPQVYAVTFLVGALTVMFDVAYVAYVPSLVQRQQILDANSKLGVSSSLAEIVGPALAGLLVQVVNAPLTLLIDALSYVASALALWRIERVEPVPPPAEIQPGLRREAGEGLSSIVKSPTLTALAGSLGQLSFFGGFFGALYGLWVLRGLGLSPAVLGLLVGAGGIGALAGAFVTTPLTQRLGTGRTTIVALGLTGVLSVLTPLAGGPKWVAIGMLLVGQVAGDMARAVFAINQITLLQASTPPHLLGRVNASTTVVAAATGTAGLLIGGLLGEVLGMRTTLLLGAAGMALACVWLVVSPIRDMHSPEI
jgi:MFS family permease